MSSRHLMAGEWIGADNRLHGPYVCECHADPKLKQSFTGDTDSGRVFTMSTVPEMFFFVGGEMISPDDPRWEEHYRSVGSHVGPTPTKSSTNPLPESFGRNLDTLEKARLWLTNPHNWHPGTFAILKWNGLLCSVRQDHGERLLREPWDDGLPWCVVFEQRKRRSKSDAGETLDEPIERLDPDAD